MIATEGDPRLELFCDLADPVRLGVLDHLVEFGPSSVSELAARLGTPVPLLSNHLRRLRESELVGVERVGRQAIYRVKDDRIPALLGQVGAVVGAPAAGRRSLDPAFVRARTCFDHLAGALGVDLYDHLVERRALVEDEVGVDLGPAARQGFARLGLDVASVEPGRRHLVTRCPDATAGKPHLGGAVGAALAESLAAQGWIIRSPEGREVHVTPAGRRALRRARV